MDRIIFVLAALAQIVYLVSAQDYCTKQCQDIPEHVVCTCVVCPEHGTCEAGEIACEKDNPVCDTTAIDHVCPKSTVCVPDNCECYTTGTDPTVTCPLKCDECADKDCAICCEGSVDANGCQESNECIPQSAFGTGTDGQPCPAYCLEECIEDENNICCSGDVDENGCTLFPGPKKPVEKIPPECDKHFCPCKCKDDEACCEGPKDADGCAMEEDSCEPPPKPECPALCSKTCDPITEVKCSCTGPLAENPELCPLPDLCMPKRRDKNGLFCPDEDEQGCCPNDCDGIMCEGCENPLGCAPKGKCHPFDSVKTDNEGNPCPKASVCPCCPEANKICCAAGYDANGCKLPEFLWPKMVSTVTGELCPHTPCPCYEGICEDGEICCPGHKDDTGCEQSIICKPCGTKTQGNCLGEPCPCVCPVQCKWDEVVCPSQIDCDGCHTQETCAKAAKDENGVFCPDDSASHGCPRICNEQAGECLCSSEADVTGCKPPALCLQRGKDDDGFWCPMDGVCPCNCGPGTVEQVGGLDDKGCRLPGTCVAVAPVVEPVPVEPVEPTETREAPSEALEETLDEALEAAPEEATADATAE